MSKAGAIGPVSGRGRLSRRRLILGAGAGSAAMALGCSSGRKQTGATSNQPSTAGQGGQPRRGGTLNYSGGFAGSYDTWGGGYDPNTLLQWGVRGYTLFYPRLV